MDIRIISWQQAIPLRHQVLWPSKPPEYCHVDGDVKGLHFGVFIDETIICVASVYLDQNKARLRKFATDANYQNQGIGSKMLAHIIHYLKSTKTDFFWCDARESAVGFYERFDMNKSSERFYKADVAYFKMEIAL
ncbi:GNAT family N-acetyltransferase [Moritella sp. Urea-trap-13]|uniref:GNAT family N-acetyltransferase n=1 Tax=Moritella sp. Urea-trap-13 TaxID=2058327 RepID=UPI000C326D8B|nr:GNAT family N-acetyltransferase [Moritella sp. Urea-trap-13]PKH06354.1 GNAT family N-acetyltransferase [Moritella sp. Urea-trap-13]